jgi:hypothetical protein
MPSRSGGGLHWAVEVELRLGSDQALSDDSGPGSQSEGTVTLLGVGDLGGSVG